MNEKHKSFAVANYILDTLDNYNIKDVTNLKLQKLLYFAYGINLVLYNEPLFTSEIHAYRLGPVVPDVYHEFKNHGNDIITTRAYYDDSTDTDIESIKVEYNFSPEEIKSIDIACAAKGNVKAWNLVYETHQKDSAWSKVFNKNKQHIKILDDDIKKEFESRIDELATYLLD